jgi:hypothetical protein
MASREISCVGADNEYVRSVPWKYLFTVEGVEVVPDHISTRTAIRKLRRRIAIDENPAWERSTIFTKGQLSEHSREVGVRLTPYRVAGVLPRGTAVRGGCINANLIVEVQRSTTFSVNRGDQSTGSSSKACNERRGQRSEQRPSGDTGGITKRALGARRGIRTWPHGKYAGIGHWRRGSGVE